MTEETIQDQDEMIAVNILCWKHCVPDEKLIKYGLLTVLKNVDAAHCSGS